MAAVRKKALEQFGERNIPIDAPMATLEEVLVPIYLSHRFQIEAVSKLIGGVDYAYTVRGDGQETPQVVDDNIQQKAITTLMKSIEPSFLAMPKNVLDIIPPKPIGFGRTRESFTSKTGVTFDPLAAAESSANATISALLHPQRVNRIIQHASMGKSSIEFGSMMNQVMKKAFEQEGNSYEAALQRMCDHLFLDQLMALAMDQNASIQTQGQCQLVLSDYLDKLERISASTEERKGHLMLARSKIFRFLDDPSKWKGKSSIEMPAGSPIGCGHKGH